MQVFLIGLQVDHGIHDKLSRAVIRDLSATLRPKQGLREARGASQALLRIPMWR